MTDSRSLSEERLHAYVDGQLDTAERGEVEAGLAKDEEAAARVRAYQAQKQALHGRFDPVLTESVPARLRDAGRRTAGSHILRAAAAVVLLLVGGAGGWFANERLAAPQGLAQAFADEAVAAHRTYTVEVRHPVEVEAAEEAHLVAWLSKRLDAPLQAPNLRDQGYELVGGRLLPTGDGAAAHLMYETSTGDRLTLYVHTNRSGDGTAFRFARAGDIGAFYWLDGPLGYALLAKADRATLLPLAQAVYNQLNP